MIEPPLAGLNRQPRHLLPVVLLISLLMHGLAISTLPAPSVAPLTPPVPLIATLVALPGPPPAAQTPQQSAPVRPPPPPSQAVTETTVASLAPLRAPVAPAAKIPDQTESMPEADAKVLAEAVREAHPDRDPVQQPDPQPNAPTDRQPDPPIPPEAGPDPSSLAQDVAAGPVADAESAAGTPVRLPSTSLPPSGTLRYTVVGTDPRTSPPTQTFGDGTVTWQHEAGNYSIDLQAAINILIVSINVLASKSTGTIEEFGLAPTRYTESPRRRPTVATNFNRDPASPLANTITFSASASSHPLVPAAQDRLSVIFQLAGLLRANPALATTGQSVNVFVAGVRGDAEVWRFVVKGREPIEAGGTQTAALHVQRLPRPESNDRAIDIWYALEHGGYPVQIRYSEANGSNIELRMKGPG